MSFLCSCAGRRRKRSESDDRQEYYRRRSRSASHTPPPPAAAATPKVKRKFPAGIAPNPSVPSDLEDNSVAAVAATQKTSKPGKTKDVAKTKDIAKVKGSTAVKDDTKTNDSTKFKDTAKVQFDAKVVPGAAVRTPMPEKRTTGTMTAPGAGEVTGYEQTILPRVRKKSPPVVAARMEVTLKSTRRADPITIATQCDDTLGGSSGSDTPRGYEASVSSSDGGSGSPRDAQTQCGFSDFSDDESSLLSLGREEGDYENTVSELRDPSVDPEATGPDVWDPGFLQHDRIWMDIKSTLMDLISDKDSSAFQELQESMKPPDLTYCTVFRKMDGTVTHKAREDSKRAVRHSFGGVAAEKVQGSRSRLNLVALRDRSDQDATDWSEKSGRRRSRGRADDDEDCEDCWTPGSDFDDKLFTPDAEVTEYYFGRQTTPVPDVHQQLPTQRKTPDAEITDFYFGRQASSEPDMPTMRSESQITLRSFPGGSISSASPALRSSMSAIWPPASKGAEKFGGSASELKTVNRGERISQSLRSSLTAIWPGGSSEKGEKFDDSVSEPKTENLPEEIIEKVVTKDAHTWEHQDKERITTEVCCISTEQTTNDENERENIVVVAEKKETIVPKEEVKKSKDTENDSVVKLRQKTGTRSYDRSVSESSSRVREGTPVAQDLKAQKELWRQGIAFDGKEFDVGDMDLETMEVEPVSAESHEKNRHHPRRINRRKETSALRSFSLEYERRSPHVARKRPGKSAMGVPYASNRTSHPPAKDHTKHRLKMKNEDKIDDDQVLQADTCETSEPIVAMCTDSNEQSSTTQYAETPQNVDSKNLAETVATESIDTLSFSGDLIQSATGLKSPGIVKNIIAGPFPQEGTTTVKEHHEEIIMDSENVHPNLCKEKVPLEVSLAPPEKESSTKRDPENGQESSDSTVTQCKITERFGKMKLPSFLPEIDAESRFISKPSEVKRSGKIELIPPSPEEEEGEDKKPLRTKKTRNVGRFLPRGGLSKDLKGEETTHSQKIRQENIAAVAIVPEPDVEPQSLLILSSVSEKNQPQNTEDSGKPEELIKEMSESSATEPDLVTAHGSPHGSVDVPIMKFRNSREDSMSKGSPDVIVQCFSEATIGTDEKDKCSALQKSTEFDATTERNNNFGKHFTAFSAGSASVETVVSISEVDDKSVERSTQFSTDEEDAQPNITGENILKENQNNIFDDTPFTGEVVPVTRESSNTKDRTSVNLDSSDLPINERVSQGVPYNVHDIVSSSVTELVSSPLRETLDETEENEEEKEKTECLVKDLSEDVSEKKNIVSTSSMSHESIKLAVDPTSNITHISPSDISKSLNTMSEYITPSLSVEGTDKYKHQDKTISTNISEALRVSPDSYDRLSDITSVTSRDEENVPLLSRKVSTSSDSSTSPRGTTADIQISKRESASPKRISYSDTFHPLPKIETTVDQTPLGSPTFKDTRAVENTSTRTPRVRLSDIVITGSVEEKIIALSKSETSHVSDLKHKDEKSEESIISLDRNSEGNPCDIDLHRENEKESSNKESDRYLSKRESDANLPLAGDAMIRSSSIITDVPFPHTVLEGTRPPLSSIDFETNEESSRKSLTVDEEIETSPSSLLSSESTAVVATEHDQPGTEEVLGSLPEHRDSFLPTVRDTKSWTPPDKTFDVSSISPEISHVKVKTNEEKTEDINSEVTNKNESKIGKVKKSGKKVGKSEKKVEKKKKTEKTDGKERQLDITTFPPTDRPIRIAVRPSTRLRSLANSSQTSAAVTPTSSSPERVESNAEEKSTPIDAEVTFQDLLQSMTPEAVSKESQSDRIVTEVSNIEVVGGLTETVDNVKDRVPKVESTSSAVTILVSEDKDVKGFVDEVLNDTAQSVQQNSLGSEGVVILERQLKPLLEEKVSKEKSKTSETPERETLETDIWKPELKFLSEVFQRVRSATPRDSLDRDSTREISSLTNVSPRDSLDSQSRRDSELTPDTDSLQRDSISEDDSKAKSQSPCDSLDEDLPPEVSDSIRAASQQLDSTRRDTDTQQKFTPTDTPRDSLEGSPTKSLSQTHNISFSGSVDEDKILNFSSVWSPRISLQQEADRDLQSVPTTTEPTADTDFVANPSVSHSDLSRSSDAQADSESIRDSSGHVVRSQQKTDIVNQHVLQGESSSDCKPVTASTSQEILTPVSPSMVTTNAALSPRNSYDGHSKSTSYTITKGFDCAANVESTPKDDMSSVSSVASPRDSLSSKRESSSTMSDPRLSTTDTSVIDDLLGVGSCPLTKEWLESSSLRESGSGPDSPQRTPLRASLAVEECLSSSPAASPRDSMEESEINSTFKSIPESPPVNISRETTTSISPKSSPRDTLDMETARSLIESYRETPHRVSLADNDNTKFTSHRDSVNSAEVLSPRLSQKEITETFQKFFSSLDPKLAGLRDSKLSCDSGDSRRSASDSDFDIIDFAEPELLVLSNLPEEKISYEQTPETPPALTSNEPTPTVERTQSMLSGGFDIMYIDTSSFEDDKTPKEASESESSPTREVAKVMEELANVLANAEQGFDTDSVTSRPDSLSEKSDRKSSTDDTWTETPHHKTSKTSFDEQLERDKEVFRKIAESSMEADVDVEASFDAMVSSLITPRSFGVVDEKTNEEQMESIPTNTVIDRKKVEFKADRVPSVVITDEDTDIHKGNDVSEPFKSTQSSTSPVHTTSSGTVEEKEHILKSIAMDKKLKLLIPDTDTHKLQQEENLAEKKSNVSGSCRTGETDVRESTFDLSKKVQEMLKGSQISLAHPESTAPDGKRTPKKVSQSSEKASTNIQAEQTSTVESDLEQCPPISISVTEKHKEENAEIAKSSKANACIEESKDQGLSAGSSEKSHESKDELSKAVRDTKEKSVSAVPQIKDKKQMKILNESNTLSQGSVSEITQSENDFIQQHDIELTRSNVRFPTEVQKAQGYRKTSQDETGSRKESDKIDNAKDQKEKIEESKKLSDETAESPTKEKSIPTQSSKRRTKSKTKSLSVDSNDSLDALSVAIEKNIPLPPDDDPHDEELSVDKSEKETKFSKSIIIDETSANSKNIQSNIEREENERQENEKKKEKNSKAMTKRHAGDWSKSFSLESNCSLTKEEENEELSSDNQKQDVTQHISTRSSLEVKKVESTEKVKVKSSSTSSDEDDELPPMPSILDDDFVSNIVCLINSKVMEDKVQKNGGDKLKHLKSNEDSRVRKIEKPLDKKKQREMHEVKSASKSCDECDEFPPMQSVLHDEHNMSSRNQNKGMERKSAKKSGDGSIQDLKCKKSSVVAEESSCDKKEKQAESTQEKKLSLRSIDDDDDDDDDFPPMQSLLDDEIMPQILSVCHISVPKKEGETEDNTDKQDKTTLVSDVDKMVTEEKLDTKHEEGRSKSVSLNNEVGMDNVADSSDYQTSLSDNTSQRYSAAEKNEDSGVEDEGEESSKSEKIKDKKSHSSKKTKTRGHDREMAINRLSEETLEEKEKQEGSPPVVANKSNPEWSGPLRRGKESRRSVKTSKSRSVSLEEQVPPVSSLTLPSSEMGDECVSSSDVRESALVTVGSVIEVDKTEEKTVKVIPTKSISKEDEKAIVETLQEQISSSIGTYNQFVPSPDTQESVNEIIEPITEQGKAKRNVRQVTSNSNGNKESSLKTFQGHVSVASEGEVQGIGSRLAEKPRSILKSSSREDVIGESQPSQTLSSQDQDIRSLELPSLNAEKQSDNKSDEERLSTSSEISQPSTIKSTSEITTKNERTPSHADDGLWQHGDLRRFKNMKSKSSSREEESGISFPDEKYVTAFTESQTPDIIDFSETLYQETRSCRSSRRRSTSKSVSFEDDVVFDIPSIDVEHVENIPVESSESKFDRDTSLEIPIKSKVERRKSPKKKSKSKGIIDREEISFDSSFEIIPEHTLIPEFEGVTEPDPFQILSNTNVPSPPRIQILEEAGQDFEVPSHLKESRKSKVERRKSPKKKSSKIRDEEGNIQSTIQGDVNEKTDLCDRVRGTESDFLDLDEKNSHQTKSPDSKERDGEVEIVSSEFLLDSVEESISSDSRREIVQKETDVIANEGKGKERESGIERRKSPKKKSKSKTFHGDDEAMTYEDAHREHFDENIPFVYQHETLDVKGTWDDFENTSIKIERRKSPKKKQKHKKGDDKDATDFIDPLGATVIENLSAIPITEQMESDQYPLDTCDKLDQVSKDDNGKQRIERRKSPKKKSKSKVSDQEIEVFEQASPARDTFVTLATPFQMDERELLFTGENNTVIGAQKTTDEQSRKLRSLERETDHSIRRPETTVVHAEFSDLTLLENKPRGSVKSKPKFESMDSLFVNLSREHSLEMNEDENESLDRYLQNQRFDETKQSSVVDKGMSIKGRSISVESEDGSTKSDASSRKEEKQRKSKSKSKSKLRDQTIDSVDEGISPALSVETGESEHENSDISSKESRRNSKSSQSRGNNVKMGSRLDERMESVSQDDAASASGIPEDEKFLEKTGVSTSEVRTITHPENISRCASSHLEDIGSAGVPLIQLENATCARDTTRSEDSVAIDSLSRMDSANSTSSRPEDVNRFSANSFTFSEDINFLTSAVRSRPTSTESQHSTWPLSRSSSEFPYHRSSESLASDISWRVPKVDVRTIFVGNVVPPSKSSNEGNKTVSESFTLAPAQEETTEPRRGYSGSFSTSKSSFADLSMKSLSFEDALKAYRDEKKNDNRKSATDVTQKSVSIHSTPLGSTDLEKPLSIDDNQDPSTRTSDVKYLSRGSSTASHKSVSKLGSFEKPTEVPCSSKAESFETKNTDSSSVTPTRLTEENNYSPSQPENIVSMLSRLEHGVETISCQQRPRKNGIPISVCAPLRWSAALPENIDLSREPGEMTEETEDKEEESTEPPSKSAEEATKSAIRCALDVAKELLRMDLPRTGGGRSRSPRPGAVAPVSAEEASAAAPAAPAAPDAPDALAAPAAPTAAASPSARRRRARARRRAAAVAAERLQSLPSIAGPLDWAAEVEAELQLEEAAAAAAAPGPDPDPSTPSLRRKRKRHRRKRAPPAAAAAAAAAAAPAADADAASTSAPGAGRVKRLKSCEEEGSSDAADQEHVPPLPESRTRQKQEKVKDTERYLSPPLSPRRIDDDPTPWNVVRSRRHRRDQQKTRSFEGEGFQFQDPAKSVRLSSGSETGDPREVFYFAAEGDRRERRASPALLHERRHESKTTVTRSREGLRDNK